MTTLPDALAAEMRETINTEMMDGSARRKLHRIADRIEALAQPVAVGGYNPPAGDELCSKCDFTLDGHISNTGVVYPCWTPSGVFKVRAQPPMQATQPPATGLSDGENPPLPLCWTGSPVTVTWAEDGETSTREVYTAEQMVAYRRLP